MAISLPAINRLVQAGCATDQSADSIIAVLWQLMDAHCEELRLLQAAALLINAGGNVVKHDSLAKGLVICFRLHFSKDPATANTAAATVKQLVSVVFDRAAAESDGKLEATSENDKKEENQPQILNERRSLPPKTLKPHAADAYMLFQDFCLLINGEPPHWLVGISEMTRTLCLELIDSTLSQYHTLFLKHPEFCILVKDKVCPILISLFSPTIRPNTGTGQTSSQAPEKAFFPITNRIMRIVKILVQHYFHLIPTESEIFLQLLAKLTDSEKPQWQRCLAVEVTASIFRNADLVRSIVLTYDSRPHSTKVLQDLVSSLAAFLQSSFLSSLNKSGSTEVVPTQTQTASNSNPNLPQGSSAVQTLLFTYRGVSIPLLFLPSQHPPKPLLLEMLDKHEVAVTVPDGYGATVAFCALLDLVNTCQALVERPTSVLSDAQELRGEQDEKQISEQIVDSIWCPILAALSLMLESSSDESAAEAILKAVQSCASMAGKLGKSSARDAFITALCKASLPPNYTLTILNTASFNLGSNSSGVLNRSNSVSESNSTGNSGDQSSVVAVGNPLLCSSLVLGNVQGPVTLTTKNIQCMRAVLSLAHCHGAMLGPAWQLVLATLQHLCYSELLVFLYIILSFDKSIQSVLGLRPAVGGSLRADRPVAADIALSPSQSAGGQTNVQNDLPILAAMLSRLFESSQYLDEVALHHLLTALCNLSQESMEVAYSANREPSLFPIAKLLETGLVNLPRLETLWKPLTNHLLEVIIFCFI